LFFTVIPVNCQYTDNLHSIIITIIIIIMITITIIIIIIIISIAPIPRGPMDCHYLAILRTGQMCHFKNALPSDSPQHHFVFNLKIKIGAF